MGAAPGTDVYSPVDGTIVGITPLMLRGKVFGARIDVQPTNEPALVVRLTHLRPDPALTVGSSVACGDLEDRHGHRLLDGRAAGARALHAGRGEPRLDRSPSPCNTRHPLRILFVADVNGRPGLRAVEERLPALREELDVDFCVTNGENAADGVGITPKLADKLLAAGADVLTLGNHTWRRREIVPVPLAAASGVIRPANLSAQAPGRGLTVAPARDGTRVAVINLLGRPLHRPAVAPFEVIDDARRGGSS